MSYPHQNTQASNKSIMKTQVLEPLNGKLRELITYPPHKANFVISGKYIKTCEMCRDRYGAKACHALYCSDACRVRASRVRAGRCSNRREAAQKTVHTKHSTNHLLICECCEREFYGNGYDVNIRKYCGDACKQKAYRQRRAEAKTEQITLKSSPSVTSMPVTRRWTVAS